MRRCLLALYLLAFTYAQGASAPTESPTPQGWKRFQAEDGSFSGLVPVGAQTVYSKGYALPGAYTANYQDHFGKVRYDAVWRVGAPDTDLVKAAAAYARTATVASRKDIECEGKKGLELTLRGEGPEAGALIILRVLLGQNRYFIAAYVAAPEMALDRPAREAEAATYFASFHPQLDRPPSEDAWVPIRWKGFAAKDGSFSCRVPAEFDVQTGGNGGGCFSPGRIVFVRSAADKKGIEGVKARLAKSKSRVLSQKEVKSGGWQGLELVLQGIPELEGQDDFFGPAFVTHVLWLSGGGRLYALSLSGLRGDATVGVDSRYLFDSFKAKGFPVAPADLQEALKQASTMLEKKQYDAFLKRFLDPVDRANILKQRTESELAQSFGSGQATTLLKQLKSLQGQQPEMNENGTEASYKLAHESRPILFRKINGLWYVKN